MPLHVAVAPSHLDVAVPPPGQLAVQFPSAGVPVQLGQVPLFVRDALGLSVQDTGSHAPSTVAFQPLLSVLQLTVADPPPGQMAEQVPGAAVLAQLLFHVP